MFDILSPEEKSLVVRMKVRYVSRVAAIVVPLRSSTSRKSTADRPPPCVSFCVHLTYQGSSPLHVSAPPFPPFLSIRYSTDRSTDFAPPPTSFPDLSWMSSAAALPTGLGLVSEGREVPLSDLPPWTEDKVKTSPALWKNPVTGGLHLQIHPSAVHSLHIEALPEGVERKEGQLWPEGGKVEELTEVRKTVYGLQRGGIRPELVYPHGKSMRCRPLACQLEWWKI